MVLTDEEKAKAFENAVETSEKETDESEEEATKSEEEQETEETNSEESKGTEGSDSTLTKPYDWLKGENPEDWVKELKTAYDNSTSGALTLKKERDDALKIVEEAKKIIASGGKEESKDETPSSFDLSGVPEIQWVRGLQQKQIEEAYDSFAKEYPQAREPANIQKVQEAVPGLGQALEKALGRQPTYQEIFDGAAKLLNWQPDRSAEQAKKDAKIKETSASSAVQSSSKTVSRTKITEEQLEVARKLFPGQSDADIVKDLSKYV